MTLCKICEFFLEVFLVRIIIIAILINNTFESIAINKTMSKNGYFSIGRIYFEKTTKE